jgi:ATP adenylyltransferase/5',5'''-P-1,P-4-tetraphosphate phosphorylase II
MRGRRSATGKAQEIFWLKQVARQACLAPNISKSENFLQRRMWHLIRPRNRFTHAISGLSGFFNCEGYWGTFITNKIKARKCGLLKGGLGIG